VVIFGAALSGADPNDEEWSGPRDSPGGMVVLRKLVFNAPKAVDQSEKPASTDRVETSLNQHNDEPVGDVLPDRRPGERLFAALSRPQAIFCLIYGD